MLTYWSEIIKHRTLQYTGKLLHFLVPVFDYSHKNKCYRSVMSQYRKIIPCHLFLIFLNFPKNVIYINSWGQNR